MNKPLTVGLYQMNIDWENPDQNIIQIEKTLNAFSTPLDLLVLPEMFTTGFSATAKHLAWKSTSDGFIKMKTLSKTYHCSIIGSVLFQENDHYYNRCFHWLPDGTSEYYDKVHLFSLAKEGDWVSPGKEQLIFTVKNWKVKPQICYDLRFPTNSYNQKQNPYDILLYVANWPKPRIKAWQTLLKARAIENQSYVIGVNRVGEEPNNIMYNGLSALLDFFGNDMLKFEENKAEILVKTIEKKALVDFRKRFPFINDEI